jgi:2-dehydropantoate 2-reductase
MLRSTSRKPIELAEGALRKMSMHVVIVGAGGVGGYLGGRLISAGVDVTFLVRDARAAQLKTQGLAIESPLGDYQTPAKVITSASQTHAPDFVILACKAPGLDSALAAALPLISPGTRILPILNGVCHIDMIGQRMPANELTAGIVHGGLSLREDGVVAHLTSFFTVIVGPISGKADPLVQAFVEHLKSANANAVLSPDIHQDLWDKFVFLTTLAGITCLMRGNIGTIVGTDAGRELILQLFNECMAVARHEGREPSAAAISKYRALLTETGSTFTSSMLRDIEAGRKTEADHIIGDMLRRAQAHGLSTPLLRTVATHLQTYEAQRSSSSH